MRSQDRRSRTPPKEAASAGTFIRINSFLAKAGLGSRRAVETHVLDGHVRVNGEVIRDLGRRVDPATDRVECLGRTIQPLPFQYIMLHKPTGYACTREDPHAKRTIYDLLPNDLSTMRYAGRLDLDSEGLLLLSNDGIWLEQITHPRHGVAKIYEVIVRGRPLPEIFAQAKAGIRSRGELLRVESMECISYNRDNSKLKIILKEGKNREIRRICLALGHPVRDLKRIAVGPLRLGNLASGSWRPLSPSEVRFFQESKQGNVQPPIPSRRAFPIPTKK